MTRAIHKLTDRKVKSLSTPGRVSDGGGLYIRVRNADAKSWAFVCRQGEKWTEIGLGAYPDVALTKARNKAAEMRSLIADGKAPRLAFGPTLDPTFKEAAAQVIESMEAEWSNAKHRYQWEQTLGPAYCSAILERKVSAIGLDDVLAVLTPVWQKKPETASRLRSRLERVLNFAKTKRWRSGENPAIWRGNLENVLPKRDKKKTVTHLAALPYGDVPGFVTRLRAVDGGSARALEFQILTACRTSEVLGATWQEIDAEAALWVIPKHRMKARKEHRVPLSSQAVKILKTMAENRISDYVFPGLSVQKPLSNMALAMLMRRMKVDAVPHGFRSAFRDWCGDETSFPREIAEAALAHQVGNEVERSYRRGDALAKRRALMVAWAGHCVKNSEASDLANLHG
jgi:integrase